MFKKIILEPKYKFLKSITCIQKNKNKKLNFNRLYRYYMLNDATNLLINLMRQSKEMHFRNHKFILQSYYDFFKHFGSLELYYPDYFYYLTYEMSVYNDNLC